MIKATYYQWQGLTHCVTLEAHSPDTGPRFKAWDSGEWHIATMLAEQWADEMGQSIAHIIIEEKPEETTEA